jgi:phenylacetate-CoA ligase
VTGHGTGEDRAHLGTMTAADKASLQRTRLASLVGRLGEARSEYWRSKLAGVDIAAVEAGNFGALPFTTKAEMRDAYPFGMLAVPLEETVRLHASSGTQGKPTIVAYTANDIALFAEVNARAIACAGGHAGDVIQVAYGYGLFTGGLGLHYGGERLGSTVIPASGGNPGLQVELLANLGVTGLCCTPSFAMLLAERAQADGLMDQIRLRFAVCGAEPWSEPFRQNLEAAWGGIDACDIYGLSEVIGPGVAMECRQGKGALHVFDDHFYPEVVVPGTDRPAEPGEAGELVLTTLTKEALPVLRYRTGDITSFVDGPCPCGRTHRRIARFTGRVDDMLVIRGVNVYPSAVESVLLQEPAVASQYALVVDERGTMRELEVRCEFATEAAADSQKEVAARLADRFSEILRLRVSLHLGPPGSIPRQEVGKAKRVFYRTDAEDPFPPG